MTKIALQFEATWILKHRTDKEMPVSKTNSFLRMNFPDTVTIDKETYSYLEMTIDDYDLPIEVLSSNVCKFLTKYYNDFETALLSIVNLDESDEAEACGQSAEQSPSKSFGDYIQEKIEGSSIDAKSCELLQQIEGLISGEQFKELAREVVALSPIIKANKTEKIFLNQRYLFSINDGCCLDEYINLYAKLIMSLGLIDKCDVIFEKLYPIKPNLDDPRQELMKSLSRKSKTAIVCIDIADWMNQVNSLEFKEFLTMLLAERSESILVFRIPFVDKEVLNNISRALNDMLFIRQISLPPFTNEEVGRFADKELAKYGYAMDEKAWNGFFARIREESSDGRFYGIDTIVKVVEELLYFKQVESSKSKKNSMVITAADTDKLCQSSFVDDLSGEEMLDKMVGTESIKTRVNEILSQINLVRKNPAMGSPCLHMRFVGNPGTGKTTVARIIGKILKEKGILRIGEFHEHAGRDFCGRYIGETAPKTMNLCRAAYGSVLFIDEAYSLYRENNDRDYGKEALDALIAEMENHRSDFVVIMAGYTDEMDTLMKGNAGLLSRMPYTIEFPNFTKPQLYEIFVSMCEGTIKYEKELLETAESYFNNLDDDFISSKDFSNARFVRNLYERVCAKAAMRCQLDNIADVVLTKDDFERSVGDKEFLIKKKQSRIGF